MKQTIEHYIQSKDDALHRLFEALPAPQRKLEEWKFFTNDNWFQKEWNFNPKNTISAEQIKEDSKNIPHDSLIVLENGTYNSSLSTLQDSIRLSTENYTQLAESKLLTQLDVLTNLAKDKGVTLNTNKHANGRILILSYITDSHTCTNATKTISIEENSRISITELIIAPNSVEESLIVADSKIVCNANSWCEYITIQQIGNSSAVVQTISATQFKDSTLRLHNYPLSALYARTDANIYKQGEHAHSFLYGMQFPIGNEQTEFYTRVYHNVSACETHETVKIIANDSGLGVFSGLIYVEKDAQQTNAIQNSKNMLLSSQARIHSKPQLEIYADDVSCTHGSTTGNADKEAIWYMQSRGIDAQTAMTLLLDGFMQEVIDEIEDDATKELVISQLEKKI